MSEAAGQSGDAPAESLPLRAWLALAAGLTGSLMALLNTQTTAFAVADIRGGIGAGFDEGAWITTAYSIGELAIIPVTPALAAVFSTRFWLSVNVLLFLLISICCAAAATLEQLLLLRFLQGLTGGAIIPLAFQITLQTFTGIHKPLGIAFFAVTLTFTPTIGATTDGWITDVVGWWGIFYQNLLPGALCLACAWLGLPREPINFAGLRRIDWKGAILIALGLACATCVFDQGNRLNWFANPMIADLALLALVFVALFLWHELRTEAPLVDLGLLRSPEFALPILCNALFRVGLLAASMVIPAFLVTVHNHRPLEVGTALLWVGLPQLLLAPLVLALARRIDERPIMVFGLLLFATGVMMNAGLTSEYQETQFLLSQIVQGMAQPFVQVPIMVIATSRIGPREAPSANALFNTIKTLSTTVGAGVVTTLITKREQFHSARLTESVTALSSGLPGRLDLLRQHLGDPAALATVAAQLRAQATTMAYADVLVVIGTTLVAAIAVVCLIPPPPASLGLKTWHRVCARPARIGTLETIGSRTGSTAAPPTWPRSRVGSPQRKIEARSGVSVRACAMKSNATWSMCRSAVPPRQTRTASGGEPLVTKASLATIPIPVARVCPTKAARVHGSGSGIHKWNPAGWARKLPAGKVAVARLCRAADSLRTAASSASAVPSRIHLVARAAVRGEAITVAVRTAAANLHPERTSGAMT